MSDDTPSSDIWHRPNFEQSFDKPFLFYVIFDLENTQLYLSRKVHNIDECPKELNIQYFSKDTSAEEKDYIEGFLNGPIGTYLETAQKELFDRAHKAKDVVVVSGTFPDTDSLAYLKNSVGVIKALTMNKDVPILNYQTVQLHSSDHWVDLIVEPRKPIPSHLVVILYSKEANGLWFHTRGMRTFGRPDISLVGWPEDKTQEAQGLINHFIELYASGATPEDGKGIRAQGLPDGLFIQLKGDHDNLDFNNQYIEIAWPS